MKNTTLYRSNLSNERVAFLAELKAQREQLSEDSSPKTYKRQAKAKELDVLWRSFKLNTRDEKSPGVYLLTGFVLGALSMFLLNSLFFMNANVSNSDDDSIESIKQSKIEKRINKKIKNADVTIIPADNVQTVAANEVYTVKSGDTLESIVIRFYGKYSPEKVQLIKSANSMSNINRLSIGQKLTIPLS